MSIASNKINWDRDLEELRHIINFKRPYNVEKRDLQANVNFGVISQYFADRCLETYLDKDHRLALIMNRGAN